MKRISKLICLVTVLAMGFSFAAYASDQGEGEFVPALDTEAECELILVGNYSNFESLEAEFDRFNDYYPDVELSYVKLDDYNNTISTSLLGSDMPDLYCSWPWMINKEDLGQVFESAADLADPALGINLDCIRDGLIYTDDNGSVPMVPVFATTYGMLVNEDLFAKEGIEIPRTYSDMVAACEAFRAAGYENPILGFNNSSTVFFSLAAPYFFAQIADDPEAVEKMNAMDPSAGEYYRSTLELVQKFVDDGCVDIEACNNELEDSYNGVILRFFEGDVPMMFCNGDTVSGTGKRESQSEAFTANPFAYSFYPVPSTDDGAYFLNSISMEFAVNKNGENADMAAEFLRFLIAPSELNNMASIKRLVTPAKDMSFDGVFAAFGEIDETHTVYAQETGLLDAPQVQFRIAAWKVGNGEMTVDEAVAAFGTLEE